MRRLLFVGFVICVIAVTSKAQAQAMYSSYHGGNRYDFNITSEDLNKTPIWSTDQDNPPLATRSALKMASQYIQKLLANGERWAVHNVELVPMGEHWVYLVGFYKGDRPGLFSPFRIVVLMNGEVVEPKVLPYPSR